MQRQPFTRRVGLPIRRVFFYKAATKHKSSFIQAGTPQTQRYEDNPFEEIRSTMRISVEQLICVFELKLLGATAHQAARDRLERS